MLNELVLIGDSAFLEEFVKAFNAEQDQKAHAYDAQLWKTILMQEPITQRPSPDHPARDAADASIPAQRRLRLATAYPAPDQTG